MICIPLLQRRILSASGPRHTCILFWPLLAACLVQWPYNYYLPTHSCTSFLSKTDQTQRVEANAPASRVHRRSILTQNLLACHGNWLPPNSDLFSDSHSTHKHVENEISGLGGYSCGEAARSSRLEPKELTSSVDNDHSCDGL